MDLYKDDYFDEIADRHSFRGNTTSVKEKTRKVMNREESWEYFDQIFKNKIEDLDEDLNHENACFVLTFLAAGLEEFDSLNPEYLMQKDLLRIISFYLDFLKNTKHRDEAQYIVVSKVINSLMRMKLVSEMDLFNAGITKFFLEIINDQREICRMKMSAKMKLDQLMQIKNDAEKEAIENNLHLPEPSSDWVDNYNKYNDEYKSLFSDVNYYYLESLSYFFEYFIGPDSEPKIKLCLPFFEFLQKYILDMPYTSDMKRSLFFMDCFIRYMPTIERKHFKRANRCAYSVLTSKSFSEAYPSALILLSSVITREQRQIKVFLDHFIDLFFNLLGSTDEDTVIEDLGAIEALLLQIAKIEDIPDEEVYPHIKVPLIFHHLDSISTSQSIAAMKVLRAIALLGETGSHILIENNILDTFVLVNENTSNHVKRGIFLVIAAIMKRISSDTASFLILHPIFKTMFQNITSLPEQDQISFLYGMENVLSVSEANNSLSEVEEYLVENEFISVLEELEETGDGEVCEIASTFINRLRSTNEI